MAHIQGVTVTLLITRFTVGHSPSDIPDEQFLSGKEGFDSFDEKTLGWPTIIDGFVKMSGFENPGFYEIYERLDARMDHFDTFRPV